MRPRLALVAAVSAVAVAGLVPTSAAISAAPAGAHDTGSKPLDSVVKPIGTLEPAPMQLGPVVSKAVAVSHLAVPKGFKIATSGPTVARHTLQTPAAQDVLAPTNAASSINWAGMYTTQSYTGASGSWKQPTIAKLKSDHYGSTWVGVDGANNSDLIQTGSEADNYRGHRIYRAWWEILPDAETVIYLNGKPAPVSANDRFVASIEQVGAGTWSISLQDVTRKWAFHTVRSYSGPGTSAEFIEEASQYNGDIGTPPHFQPVTFSSLQVQQNGQWHYTHFTGTNQIKLRQHDHTYAYPSGVNSRYPQYFKVYYKAP